MLLLFCQFITFINHLYGHLLYRANYHLEAHFVKNINSTNQLLEAFFTHSLQNSFLPPGRNGLNIISDHSSGNERQLAQLWWNNAALKFLPEKIEATSWNFLAEILQLRRPSTMKISASSGCFFRWTSTDRPKPEFSNENWIDKAVE